MYKKLDDKSHKAIIEALTLLENVEVKGHNNLSNLFNAMSALNFSLHNINKINGEIVEEDNLENVEKEGEDSNGAN